MHLDEFLARLGERQSTHVLAALAPALRKNVQAALPRDFSIYERELLMQSSLLHYVSIYVSDSFECQLSLSEHVAVLLAERARKNPHFYSCCNFGAEQVEKLASTARLEVRNGDTMMISLRALRKSVKNAA